MNQNTAILGDSLVSAILSEVSHPTPENTLFYPEMVQDGEEATKQRMITKISKKISLVQKKMPDMHEIFVQGAMDPETGNFLAKPCLDVVGMCRKANQYYGLDDGQSDMFYNFLSVKETKPITRELLEVNKMSAPFGIWDYSKFNLPVEGFGSKEQPEDEKRVHTVGYTVSVQRQCTKPVIRFSWFGFDAPFANFPTTFSVNAIKGLDHFLDDEACKAIPENVRRILSFSADNSEILLQCVLKVAANYLYPAKMDSVQGLDKWEQHANALGYQSNAKEILFPSDPKPIVDDDEVVVDETEVGVKRSLSCMEQDCDTPIQITVVNLSTAGAEEHGPILQSFSLAADFKEFLRAQYEDKARHLISQMRSSEDAKVYTSFVQQLKALANTLPFDDIYFKDATAPNLEGGSSSVVVTHSKANGARCPRGLDLEEFLADASYVGERCENLALNIRFQAVMFFVRMFASDGTPSTEFAKFVLGLLEAAGDYYVVATEESMFLKENKLSLDLNWGSGELPPKWGPPHGICDGAKTVCYTDKAFSLQRRGWELFINAFYPEKPNSHKFLGIDRAVYDRETCTVDMELVKTAVRNILVGIFGQTAQDEVVA